MDLRERSSVTLLSPALLPYKRPRRARPTSAALFQAANPAIAASPPIPTRLILCLVRIRTRDLRIEADSSTPQHFLYPLRAHSETPAKTLSKIPNTRMSISVFCAALSYLGRQLFSSGARSLEEFLSTEDARIGESEYACVMPGQGMVVTETRGMRSAGQWD